MNIKSYEGTENYFFVNYSHKNRDIVKTLLSCFIKDGYRFWFDEGIYSGDDWDEVVATKLLQSRCLVAFISNESVESKNCADEIRMALNNNIEIIPIFLDCDSIPDYLPGWMQLRLGTKQAVFAKRYSDDYYKRTDFFKSIYTSTTLNECLTDDTQITGGWGPEREMFSVGDFPDHAVINCLCDNPMVGDERAFVRIVECGTNEEYKSGIKIEPGKEYEVWIYFNNSSAPFVENAVLAAVARETRVSSSFPMTLAAGEKGAVSAVLSWYCGSTTLEYQKNVHKNKVWAHAGIVSDVPVNLYFKIGTAKIYNKYNNGTVMSERLFSSEGTYIGLKELNGIIMPGDGYIVYTLVVEKAE